VKACSDLSSSQKTPKHAFVSGCREDLSHRQIGMTESSIFDDSAIVVQEEKSLSSVNQTNLTTTSDLTTWAQVAATFDGRSSMVTKSDHHGTFGSN
jgi:hypothetical protein